MHSGFLYIYYSQETSMHILQPVLAIVHIKFNAHDCNLMHACNNTIYTYFLDDTHTRQCHDLVDTQYILLIQDFHSWQVHDRKKGMLCQYHTLCINNNHADIITVYVMVYDSLMQFH